MKLRCKNCGEIIESSLISMTSHVVSECKDVRIEQIVVDGRVVAEAHHRKSMNMEPIEDEPREKRTDVEGFWNDYYTP